MAVEKMELYRFLLNLLSSCPEHYDIAFRIGLLGLELPRAPASIKPLEVSILNLKLFRMECPKSGQSNYTYV